MTTVTLPWPPKGLSPNARIHYLQRSRLAKSYRAECFLQSIADGAGLIDLPKDHRPTLELLFVPPDRRRRDWDNCLAAMKHGLDGLAEAMRVDDRHFRLQLEMATDPTPGGQVRVTIR